MARRRFNRDEQRIITVGANVEWRNGHHWHPGRVVSGIKADIGWQYVRVEHTGPTTSTVMRGDTIEVYPGSIRPVTD